MVRHHRDLSEVRKSFGKQGETMSYDNILEKLEENSNVDHSVYYMAVEVSDSQLDKAKGVIESNGGEVSDTNAHENGHTIYFGLAE